MISRLLKWLCSAFGLHVHYWGIWRRDDAGGPIVQTCYSCSKTRRINIDMRDELTPETVERFMNKIDRSQGSKSCWPFIGYHDEGGYGRFAIGRTMRPGHRIAFEIFHGQIN